MSTARLYVDLPLNAATELKLPDGPARHVQVLRLQPGDALTLFDGRGGEWLARVLKMGRGEVSVEVQSHVAVERELDVAVTLALGMPANERMDMLVEKATELGVSVIQPLMTERSVLRLADERAEKRRLHWQSVAVAASEQSRRTRVPVIAPIRSLSEWLQGLSDLSDRWVLSFSGTASPLAATRPLGGSLLVLSGPEGGLSGAEEEAAFRTGFAGVSLGSRVLRADTAPLAVMAFLSVRVGG